MASTLRQVRTFRFSFSFGLKQSNDLVSTQYPSLWDLLSPNPRALSACNTPNFWPRLRYHSILHDSSNRCLYHLTHPLDYHGQWFLNAERLWKGWLTDRPASRFVPSSPSPLPRLYLFFLAIFGSSLQKTCATLAGTVGDWNCNWNCVTQGTVLKCMHNFLSILRLLADATVSFSQIVSTSTQRSPVPTVTNNVLY